MSNSFSENEEVTLSKVADGVITVAHLGAQEWKVYATRAAVIVDDDTGSSSSYMAITVSMESVEGSTLTREIKLPVYKSAVSKAG
jgi:diphthamide biosynthesis methyltransferase